MKGLPLFHQNYYSIDRKSNFYQFEPKFDKQEKENDSPLKEDLMFQKQDTKESHEQEFREAFDELLKNSASETHRLTSKVQPTHDKFDFTAISNSEDFEFLESL